MVPGTQTSDQEMCPTEASRGGGGLVSGLSVGDGKLQAMEKGFLVHFQIER